ncbi:MAG: diguanylate cyclase [Tissierellales bacterium]|nr:diguanylate cyclase [Tissierellales bacterium]
MNLKSLKKSNISIHIEKGDALFALGKEFSIAHKPVEATKYIQKALEYYELSEEQALVAKTSIELSKLYMLKRDFDKAKIFATKARFLYQTLGDSHGCCSVLNLLGTIYRKKINFSKSLFYTLEAKNVSEKLNYRDLLPYIYDNLGKTYRKIEKYNESLSFHQKALKLYDRYDIDDKVLEISIFSNIGSCYFELKDSLSSVSYYEASLSIASTLDSDVNLADVYKKLSRVYLALADYDTAILYLEQALSIYLDYSDNKGLASTYLDLGYALLKKSQTEASIKYLKIALDLAIELSLKDHMIMCYQYLSELYETIGNFEVALEFYKEYSNLKNIMLNEQNSEYLSKLYAQNQIDTMEKEKEIYRLKNIELAKAHQDLKHAYEQLEFMANKDPLTGLLNRRAMMERIGLEKNRSKRIGTSLSIILADIDYFKKINDYYGHDVGDEVLVDLSKLFKSTLRATDAICRWGGEEFLILLPDTTIEEAIIVAEKLRLEVASHSFRDALPAGKITMTMGVAEFKDHSTTKNWIKIADQALYRGKKDGRNCVRCFE